MRLYSMMSDEERRGYDAYNDRFADRYGSYDYEQGYKEHAREDRAERDRREEERQREEAEELASHRRAMQERQEEEDAYDALYQEQWECPACHCHDEPDAPATGG